MPRRRASRLRIEVNGGADEHFVVPRPADVEEAIRRVTVWTDWEQVATGPESGPRLPLGDRGGLTVLAENGGEPPDDAPVLEPDERLVTVADTIHRCDGQRLVGTNLWAGRIRIEDLYVQISTTAPTREIAVRICSDAHALTRSPPRHR